MAAQRGRRTLLHFSAVGLIAVSSACASRQPEAEKDLTLARSAIDQAEREDARALATADINRANAKYDEARKALENDDFERAERLAEEARLDAEYAEMTSRASKATDAAEEMGETIRTLESEINRPTAR